ncbi:hypothetical protein M2271_007551, partial [Streptomyces sp. LBL]|nr:hypothetical protein [Streptomyces sp. LBL]
GPWGELEPCALKGARTVLRGPGCSNASRLPDVYPDTGRRIALARAFGCARVVFNDAVRAREDARAAGEAFPKAGDLSKKLITAAKQSPARSWLGEVSSVVLQQSLRDAETAYRNFFASLKGTRKGPKLGPPCFKSRKDKRQSIRFTANARWSLTDHGQLSLPKIGAVKVKWSRTLPATPTTVTVIKDAAGRYFASFVIDTDPAADAARMPDTDQVIGIDLGLAHFAILSTGEKIDSPRFLRRAEKKLKKAPAGAVPQEEGKQEPGQGPSGLRSRPCRTWAAGHAGSRASCGWRSGRASPGSCSGYRACAGRRGSRASRTPCRHEPCPAGCANGPARVWAPGYVPGPPGTAGSHHVAPR